MHQINAVFPNLYISLFPCINIPPTPTCNHPSVNSIPNFPVNRPFGNCIFQLAKVKKMLFKTEGFSCLVEWTPNSPLALKMDRWKRKLSHLHSTIESFKMVKERRELRIQLPLLSLTGWPSKWQVAWITLRLPVRLLWWRIHLWFLCHSRMYISLAGSSSSIAGRRWLLHWKDYGEGDWVSWNFWIWRFTIMHVR